MAVLDAVRGLAPAVKIQAACFERHGAEGYAALARTLAAAHEGFQVILDWKRGDIGVSAEHYAQASRAALASDWTTVNSYLGTDGIEPFLQPGADEHGHGAFALVRTSNPSGDALQSLRLQDGRTVSEAVADMVAAAGVLRLGSRGYSDLGAVVGATKRADAAALRTRMLRPDLPGAWLWRAGRRRGRRAAVLQHRRAGRADHSQPQRDLRLQAR